MSAVVADESIGRVSALLRAAERMDYIGEPVSQLEHGLQAAHFAREAGGSDSEILAALLHDVGHLCATADTARMDDLGVLRHEDIGADYLSDLGFPASVTELVRGHVQAKRYLVTRNPKYAGKLSEASTGTLRYQGGPMSVEEAAEFERDPLFKAKLRVRAWDEAAKETDLHVASLEEYFPMMRGVLGG